MEIMKTKSCRKCSPQGKRCDCPTESERSEQGPSDATPCYPSSTPIMDAAEGWYDRRDLLAQIGILERERDEARAGRSERQARSCESPHR